MQPTDESTLSIDTLLGARKAAELVFDRLGLTNFRFDVEPREGAFEVFVEHEEGGIWHDVALTEDASVLLAVARDPETLRAVAERWQERLRAGDGAVGRA